VVMAVTPGEWAETVSSPNLERIHGAWDHLAYRLLVPSAQVDSELVQRYVQYR